MTKIFKLAQEFQDKLKSSNQKKIEQIELLYNMTKEVIDDLSRAKNVRVYTSLTDESGEDNPEFFFGPGIKKYVKNWPPVEINQQNLGGTIYPFLPRGLQTRLGYLIQLLGKILKDLQLQDLTKVKQSLNEFKTDINSVWPIFSDGFRVSLSRPLQYIDTSVYKLLINQ